LDVLGMGFERAGYCVVQGPDVLWGRSVREFHPPAGRFDGVIGGDPCQAHSALSNLVRAKGLEPSFPDMTEEFVRVVEAARPRWFLRENVPQAPDCKPQGYEVHSFLLDHSHLDSGDGTGHEQMRKRRFWFGMERPNAMAWIQDAVFEVPDLRRWIDFALIDVGCEQTVSGRHAGEIGLTGGHRGSPGEHSLEEMLRLQGLPEDLFETDGGKSPYTVKAKRKLVGNAVPYPMSLALAKAVREAIKG
jgi:DNA (cytosine-5)-methyltransferase 1